MRFKAGDAIVHRHNVDLPHVGVVIVTKAARPYYDIVTNLGSSMLMASMYEIDLDFLLIRYPTADNVALVTGHYNAMA